MFGIPVPPGVLNLVDGMPFEGPYVVKVCSSKILHKTDVGGVRLNISQAELPAVVSEMKEKFPGENILVEKMAPKGIEVIIGLIRDSTFGLAIMFGLGGIFTEVFKDVSFRVLPIDFKDAEEMVNEIKGSVILKGFRGTKADLDALYKLLLKVSDMAMALEDRIDQMDLNPVLVYEKGLSVVDAKLILRGK
ncbi:MAG: acetate--CoA ligase family protein [Thermoplasmata archaeon]